MGTATIFVPQIDTLTYFQVVKNPVSIDQKNESLLYKVFVTKPLHILHTLGGGNI
jgi:hypothetical protein